MRFQPYRSPSTRRTVRAVLFDTFGTVVDWRTGVAREAAAFAAAHGHTLDAEAFTDDWRALYQPAMEAIRSGTHVVSLGLHLPNPFAGHPGEGADRVEIEVDVGIHAFTFCAG